MGWAAADIISLIVALMNSGLIEMVVKLIERLMPAASGTEKKAIALDVLGAGVPTTGLPIVSSAVDAVVTEYNNLGTFTHKSASGTGGSSDAFAAVDKNSFAR